METARRGGAYFRASRSCRAPSRLCCPNGFSATRSGLEGPPWVSPERRARASPARVGEAAMEQRGSGSGHVGGSEHQAAAMEHPNIRARHSYIDKCMTALLREQDIVADYMNRDHLHKPKDKWDWKKDLNDLIKALPPLKKESSAAIITGLHVNLVRAVREIHRDELQAADFNNQFCKRAVDLIHSKRQEFNEDFHVQAAAFLCLRAIEKECNISSRVSGGQSR